MSEPESVSEPVSLPVPAFVKRLLRFCVDALIVYGETQFFIPDPPVPPSFPAAPGPGALRGLPPGHPERMPREQALTASERALDRQLKGL
ncbi:DUF6059 family protein [Streptomyces sp. G1]|uniref:DUF6059 family protein n=1 Tax=Streptomyces sp. G1 TaxID=361572 RepID=UPI00202E0390|nr:DUF6059 family protein [Streptomyces sp. G1]MCM1971794.1 hypothetical protein [Streptomyces sp. G1]